MVFGTRISTSFEFLGILLRLFKAKIELGLLSLLMVNGTKHLRGKGYMNGAYPRLTSSTSSKSEYHIQAC